MVQKLLLSHKHVNLCSKVLTWESMRPTHHWSLQRTSEELQLLELQGWKVQLKFTDRYNNEVRFSSNLKANPISTNVKLFKQQSVSRDQNIRSDSNMAENLREELPLHLSAASLSSQTNHKLHTSKQTDSINLHGTRSLYSPPRALQTEGRVRKEEDSQLESHKTRQESSPMKQNKESSQPSSQRDREERRIGPLLSEPVGRVFTGHCGELPPGCVEVSGLWQKVRFLK